MIQPVTGGKGKKKSSISKVRHY